MSEVAKSKPGCAAEALHAHERLSGVCMCICSDRRSGGKVARPPRNRARNPRDKRSRQEDALRTDQQTSAEETTTRAGAGHEREACGYVQPDTLDHSRPARGNKCGSVPRVSSATVVG